MIILKRYCMIVYCATIISGCCSARFLEANQMQLTYADDISLPDVNNKYHLLSDYIGRNVVLLYFWAIHNSPSVKFLHELDNLHRKYKQSDFVVLAISEVDPEYQSEAIEFAKKNRFHFDVLLDVDWQKVGATQIGAIARTSIPCGLLINKEGKVIQRFFGANRDEVKEYEKALEQIVAVNGK